ncbi:placenta-specific protein 9-like [Melanotaenia boesemani]|uniref:placenta-specific protein 9-like n=1 Tax=Melanotaenia boesemani TaxID=1250792 RepID=UPI001C04A6E4|nr:placenta-specific protein 9-like [Melanotaenia boesemani]
MTHPTRSAIGLLLIVIGYTAAAPDSDLWPRVVRSSACQEHTNLHKRLDVVEKRVENTVEKLESELAVLLEAIDAPQWRPLLEDTGEPTVDILQDPEEKGQS